MISKRVLPSIVVVGWVLVTSVFAQVSPNGDGAKEFAKRLLELKTDQEVTRSLDENRVAAGPAVVNAILDATDPTSSGRSIIVLRIMLDRARKGGDRATELRASFALGKLLFESGAAGDGAAVFNSALKDTDKDPPLLAGEFKIDIGSVYKDAEEFETALPLLLDGRNRIKDVAEPYAKELRVLATLGIAACEGELGKYSLELDELNRAEKEYSGNVAVLASLENEYGVLWDFLGNETRSESAYREAIANLRTLPPSDETTRKTAIIQVNLGLLQTSKLGAYDDALTNFAESKRTLSGNQQVLPLILMNESIAYRKLGRFKEGLDAAKAAFDMITKQEAGEDAKYKVCDAYNQYAAALIDVGDYKEALEKAMTAETMAADLPELKWMIFTTEGLALDHLGQPEKSRKAYEKAIEIAGDLEETAIGDESNLAPYLSGLYYPFYMRADLEVRSAHYDEALLLTELAKARSIRGAIRGIRNNPSAGLSDADRQDEFRLTQTLTEANKALSKAESAAPPDPREIGTRSAARNKAREELEKFHLHLYASNREVRIRRVHTVLKTVNDLSRALDNSSVALDFIVSDDAVQVLVVRKDRGDRVAVTGADLHMNRFELQNLVSQFRSFMDPEVRGGFSNVAKELYRRLIKPIENQLPKNARLIIVPDGALWDLPFPALQDDAGSYLIHDHSISLAPSLFSLAELETREDTVPKRYQRFMLALGDPDTGANRQEALKMGGQLGRLRFSNAFVRNLCKRFASCGTTFVDEKATEKVLKSLAAGSRIIQVSAHGIFDNGSPPYSHVVLTPTAGPGPPEDGLLEAWEIMNLDLSNTDLVVLSACETGRGKLLPGEGILGLTWATFVAGCPSVVATEWDVNDESTAILMDAFYRKLYAGGSDVGQKATASKAAAMQEAMKQMFTSPKYSRFSHPAFWSGFVVIGKSD